MSSVGQISHVIVLLGTIVPLPIIHKKHFIEPFFGIDGTIQLGLPTFGLYLGYFYNFRI